MKRIADDLNEVCPADDFRDSGSCVVTPVVQFEPATAASIVQALAGVVRRAHQLTATTTADRQGITRAQTFEEGDVYMLEAPFEGFHADRYLMDFYDVTERGICSRMHLHTGLRFVRMMTGPETIIRVSSFAPFELRVVSGLAPFVPDEFVDVLPGGDEHTDRTRYNLIVPPNSWIDLQIPSGTSHQFNAIGPNAVIDSVHPEESIEVLRENMSGYRMMAQTIFLAEERPAAATCGGTDRVRET
ncbi:hypothetical protein [Mycobacterium spongiae]|uniref:Uncharacterized protein n=1 Tax=Mycobacterium spongiae TaxID=886343 RepID=A0A975PYF0_9MYCO|nr:hypothetical protein [Mycobacterium spongiae]QUR69251.1 hypothetical protein F6B93_21185 [Mycobacterium spongiae]